METTLSLAPLTEDERRLLLAGDHTLGALTNCAPGTEGAVLNGLHRKGLMRCEITRGERPELDRYRYLTTAEGRAALNPTPIASDTNSPPSQPIGDHI
ncbi:MAG: hypothetical protein ACM3YN_08350 [Parcubacteria group bacterium]